jgi:serine/threonine-protein kinase
VAGSAAARPRPQPEGDVATRSGAVLLESLRQATLGEYEVVGELGRGGMAIVYLAHDIALDRKVAIKVISPNVLWLGEGIPERFKREARTAAKLSHPHIIPIYAVKESGELLYFVMKYVKGRTLESVIGEVGPLPVAMVHTILSQAGSALGYAHRQGVVHRDIKPGNVMLDEEGWAVITDFGIAKVATAEGLTQTGGTVGTPAYMSPEQCSGLPVTGASDQYSLGVVAYEMLTGRKPFEAESAMTLMYKHCNTPPPPLNLVVADCPPALSSAVMRMLAKEPRNRWRSLEEMVAALGPVPPGDSDRVRTQMLTLAQSAGARAIVERFQTTPPSPVPRDRLSGSLASASRARETARAAHTPGAVTQRIGIRPSPLRALAWTVPPAAAVAAVLLVWGPWRSQDATSSGAPSAPAPLPMPPPVSPQGPIVTAVDVTPGARSLIMGDTLRLAAAVLDERGNTVESAEVAWESSNPVVARVSSRGLVSALAPGNAEITALSEGRVGTARITVAARAQRAPAAGEPPRLEVASVAVTPGTATLTVGGTLQLNATPRDRGGRALGDRAVSWESSDERVVRVTQSGVVIAVGEGTARITASSEGRSGAASVTVTPIAVASLVVTPSTQTLQAGDAVQLSATASDAAGNVLAGRPVAWTSSDRGVAEVSSGGRVTAVAAGSAVITAASGGVSGAARITVTAAPVAAADPRPAIEAVLGAYAQAIQNRDLGEIRRLYPDITPQQEGNWTQFFDHVRDLRVRLAIRDVSTEGDVARARAELTLEFRNAQRNEQTSTVSFTLGRRGDAWRITSVR